MPVVCEGIGDPEPPHHDEGNVVDDAGLSRFTPFVSCPRVVPVVPRRHNQLVAKLECLPERTHIAAKRATSRGVGAFQQNERGFPQMTVLQVESGQNPVKLGIVRAKLSSPRSSPDVVIGQATKDVIGELAAAALGFRPCF